MDYYMSLKRIALACALSFVSAQDCLPSYSFDVGPFTYHVVMDCVGSSSTAIDMCQDLNGTLALMRSGDAIQNVADYVFERGPIVETVTTEDPLEDIVGSEEIISTTTSTTDAPSTVMPTTNYVRPTTPTAVVVQPPVPVYPDDNGDSSGSSDSSSSSDSDDRRKRSAGSGSEYFESPSNLAVSACTESHCSSNGVEDSSNQHNESSIHTAPIIYTFLVAPFVGFPDAGDYLQPEDTQTCATLQFWEGLDYSQRRHFELKIINGCNDSEPISPWICETISESYQFEAPGAVPVTRTVQTVMDYRPTAVFVGTTGIAMLVVVMVIVFILDVPRLVNDVRHVLSSARHYNKGKSDRCRKTSPESESSFSSMVSLTPSNYPENRTIRHEWRAPRKSIVLLNEQSLYRSARLIVGIAGFQDYDLGVMLVSDKTMARMNYDYRGFDEATDVLAFPFHEIPVESAGLLPQVSDEEKMLGDIVLGMPYIREQSVQNGTDLMNDIMTHVTHGLCHLVGYDHHTASAWSAMYKRELHILERFNQETGSSCVPLLAIGHYVDDS